MSHLYASPRTTVLQHKQLSPEAVAQGAPAYEHSGWCQFEQGVASLGLSSRSCGGFCAEPRKLLQIGDQGAAADKVVDPAEVAALLRDEARTRFLGSADREMVTKMYVAFHERMTTLQRESRPWLVRRADANIASCGRAALTLLGLVAIAGGVFALLYFAGKDELSSSPFTSVGLSWILIVGVSVSVCGAGVVVCICPSREFRVCRCCWGCCRRGCACNCQQCCDTLGRTARMADSSVGRGQGGPASHIKLLELQAEAPHLSVVEHGEVGAKASHGKVELSRTPPKACGTHGGMACAGHSAGALTTCGESATLSAV